MSACQVLALAPVVAAAAFAYDFAAARYYAAMKLVDDEDDELAEECASTAGNWAVVLCLIGVVASYSVIRCSVWLLLPELVGVRLGTYYGALYERRRKRR